MEKGSSPGPQVLSESEKVAPVVTVDSSGLVTTKKIGEARDFELPFMTHPTSGSINALARKVGHASSDQAIGRADLPFGDACKTVQLIINHAAEVVSCFQLCFGSFACYCLTYFFPQTHTFMCKSMTFVVAELLGRDH